MNKNKNIIRYRETKDSRRQKLINYAEKVVFPNILDTYWKDCFIHHLYDSDPKFVKEDVFIDCFKNAELKQPYEKKLPDGRIVTIKTTYQCVIPAIRWFWDIILTLYHLYAPDVFPTFFHVAKALYEQLECIKQSGIHDPLEYENYSNYIHEYLRKNADLETAPRPESNLFSFFLTNPGQTVFECQRAQVLLARSLGGEESDEEIQQMEKEFLVELVEKLKLKSEQDLTKELEQYGIEKLENIFEKRLKNVKLSKLVEDLNNLKEETLNECYSYMIGNKK